MTAQDPEVSKPYVQLLVQLDRASYAGLPDLNGTAELDRFGRLMVGADKTLIAGDSAAWLRLLSFGCIEHLPKTERIRLTARGKQLVEEWHARLNGNSQVSA